MHYVEEMMNILYLLSKLLFGPPEAEYGPINAGGLKSSFNME
jgi:hypothetical protein